MLLVLYFYVISWLCWIWRKSVNCEPIYPRPNVNKHRARNHKTVTEFIIFKKV